jgi:hypothetical protein
MKEKIFSGIMTFKSGDKYIGEFSENAPYGNGRYCYKDGGIDEGRWEQGVRHGLARYESVDGTVEEVIFVRKSTNIKKLLLATFD